MKYMPLLLLLTACASSRPDTASVRPLDATALHWCRLHNSPVQLDTVPIIYDRRDVPYSIWQMRGALNEVAPLRQFEMLVTEISGPMRGEVLYCAKCRNEGVKAMTNFLLYEQKDGQLFVYGVDELSRVAKMKRE